MPKRKQRTVEYYQAKIRKLKQKSERRRYNSDSSLTDTERNQDVGAYGGCPIVDPEQIAPIPECVAEPQLHPETELLTDPVESLIGVQAEISAGTSQPELDPELLSALGDANEDVPVFGEDIHSSLPQRWTPILKKGLSKDTKTKLLNEYPVPNNCKLLKAPTLHPEISAAVADVVRNRDKSILAKQDQLGQGIAAVSKAISLLLTGEDKVQAVKILSDGCRLLADLHYIETQLRTKLVTPCLQKSILCVIENQNRDETLFGVDLPEKIKSSKAIEKQGNQLKKVTNKPPVPTSIQVTPRARYQENWQGPPRYPSVNRGGRGGQHRPVGPQYRRPAPTTAPMTSRMPFNHQRQRAPRQ